MQTKPTTVFVIREVATGKLIKFGVKCGWVSISAAKGAFNHHMTSHFGKSWNDKAGLFDSQDEYTIEEIS